MINADEAQTDYWLIAIDCAAADVARNGLTAMVKGAAGVVTIQTTVPGEGTDLFRGGA